MMDQKEYDEIVEHLTRTGMAMTRVTEDGKTVFIHPREWDIRWPYPETQKEDLPQIQNSHDK